MVAEIEPNNSIASAQALNLGLEAGEDQFVTVTGRIAALPSRPASSYTVPFVSGEDGSIPDAVNTTIRGGDTKTVTDTTFLTDGSDDTNFYKLSANAGQLVSVNANGPFFTPSIIVYNAEGGLVDFDIPITERAALAFVAPEDGEYFVSIQPLDVLQFDPFDPDSTFALFGGDRGTVDVRISLTSPDVDYYSVELEVGDVFGAAVDGAGTTLIMTDPSGDLVLGIDVNISTVYGSESELVGDANDNAAGGFVAATAGTYTVAVAGETAGAYTLETSVHRPELEGQAAGNIQYIYLDFDGASVSRSIFDETAFGTASLSGLSTFLDDFGLANSAEDDVIDAVILQFEIAYGAQVAASGGNPDFQIEILNSRDHADVFGSTNVSRVIIGGDQIELGIETIGIAENIDIGNFDTEDQAVVLLDTLSGPSTDPNSINSISRGLGVSKAEAVGTVVGSVAVHEAAHLLGGLHTLARNDVFNIQDAGGVYLYPVGNDGRLGTADDPEFIFKEDRLALTEGLYGTQNTATTIAWAGGTGTGIGFSQDILASTFGFIGDDADDRISIYDDGQALIASDRGGNFIVAPSSTDTIVVDAGDGDNLINVETFIPAGGSITTGSGADRVFIGGGSMSVSVGAGDDRVAVSSGVVSADGGDGNDTILFSFEVFGGSIDLNDTSVFTNFENVGGSDGNDTLTGDDGDNILTGYRGADVLDGGDGIDIASFENDFSGAVIIDLAAGTARTVSETSSFHGSGDTLTSIEGAIGTSFDDILIGNDVVNVLRGLGGDDVLSGGAEADELDGGDGTDRADYSASALGVIVDLAAGTGLGGDAEGDTLTSIEALTGSAFDDVLTAGIGPNALDGGAGDDLIAGGTGTDSINGGDGIDTVSYADAIQAVVVDLGLGTADEGDGNPGDTLTNVENVLGSALDDSLTGDALDNVLNGLAGGDTLIGGDGDDRLMGGAGRDVLDGGEGRDVASYLSAAAGVRVDLVNETINTGDALGDALTSIEVLEGSDFADSLRGLFTDDEIFGAGGADVLRGRDGNDFLSGGAGDDLLQGQNDDDILVGGAGADTLDGGAGIDTASYADAASLVRIDLRNAGFAFGDAVGDTLTSIERIEGSDFADSLRGDTADDILIGGLGDDALVGRDGDDFLIGGAGADRLLGGAGVDTAGFGAAAEGVRVDLLNAGFNIGEAAGDELVDIENLVGTGFADILRGDNAANSLSGGDGADILIGRDGDDLLAGGTGADRMDGGSGKDTVSYADAAEAVRVDLRNAGFAIGEAAEDELISIESLVGSAFDDILRGEDDANVLSGGAGADILIGRGGDDILIGGAGADRMVGGSGIDEASYADAGWIVRVDLENASFGFGDAEGDLLEEIENLTGSSFADSLRGNDAANVIVGGGGDDALIGRGGDDLLIGGAGADRMVGGDGFDVVSYGGSTTGVRVILTNTALSTGDASGDTLIEIESVEGSAFDDFLRGTTGADGFKGGDGIDQLIGLGGDDDLSGGSGSDTLQGGFGDDVLQGGDDADVLDGGAGIDIASYRDARGNVRVDLVRSDLNILEAAGDVFIGIEGLEGSDFNDSLRGNSFANVILGGDGDDALFGREGADTLRGGAGSDRLYGEEGADRFEFAAGDGADRIIGFENGSDSIALIGTGLGFGDLVIADGVNGAVVSYGADSIQLDGVSVEVLDETDFVFV